MSFTATENHINKSFYPVDNSYMQEIININEPDLPYNRKETPNLLAGDESNMAQLVTIISEPYKIDPASDDTFVKVFCNNKYYRVLNIFYNDKDEMEDGHYNHLEYVEFLNEIRQAELDDDED